MSIWGAVMGGANYLHHGIGWMEGGLVASYEKAVLDAEMLQDMASFLQPTADAGDWRRSDRPSAGEPESAAARANRIWKRLLADYEPPPLDPAIEEAIRDFIERRKREGGVKAA